MRIKNFFNKLRRMPKRYVAAIAAGAIIAIPIAVHAGYGPNRPVFDWNNEADRKGSVTGPVFNSFINTPTYGDERAFVDAKDATSTTPGGFADTVNVEGGKEYTVRAYVHNNANQALNDAEHNFLGVAKNTKVKFTVLPGVAVGNEVTGFISADNATPTTVYDTVKLKNDTTAFSLEYVPGSARMESNVHPFPGVPLPDSITTTGALIGDNQDGNLPGCFNFTEIVTIKVRVKTPSLTVQKGVTTVEAPKPTDLHDNITVKPGDTVTWRIDFKNNGTDPTTNTTIRDPFPASTALVPGSITWFDSNNLNGRVLPDTALGSGGSNVGTYQPNTNGVIRFRTVISKDTHDCEITNVAFARADNVPELQDNAKVTIDSDFCKPKTPIYSCDLLTVELVNGRTYKYTVSASATGGATITQYMFNFGDNQTLNSSSNSVQHTYGNAGSFVTVAKVQVRANGEDKIAESAACAKPVTITEHCDVPGKESLPVNSPECKVTPGTPTVLPNTGPGDVIGIFGAVTVAGALVHKYILSRRFNV